MTEKFHQLKNSFDTADLQAAIEKLENFAKQTQCKSLEFIPEEKSMSTLKKTFQFARQIISSPFSDKLRKQKEIQKSIARDELLKAIETIKKNYLIIQKMAHGSSTQQKLAAKAIAAYNHCRGIILKSQKKMPGWSDRIAKFVYQYLGSAFDQSLLNSLIELPQTVLNDFDLFKNPELPKKIHQTSGFLNHSSKTSHQISTTEKDAFRMKAITLLNLHGIPFTLFSENLLHMESMAVIEAQEGAERSINNSIISITQTIKPFPGEEYQLVGRFKRDQRSHVSIPIRNSFQLFPKSIQTGFPHPSQHTGWALADQLIPPLPQYIEKLTLLQPLYQRKHEVANALLSKGKLLLKGKELLQLKRQCFEKNRDFFIEQHRQLNQAIFLAAKSDTGKNSEVIDRYFILLKTQKVSYDTFSETHDLMIKNFIVRPLDRLKNEWLDKTNAGLLSEDSNIRYETAQRILKEETELTLQEWRTHYQEMSSENEKMTADYIMLMGKILNTPSQAISLQQFSEIIGFTPPLLSDFAERIQFSTYKQLYEFNEELDSTDLNQLELMEAHLIKQTNSDIHVFTSSSLEDIDDPLVYIVKELDAYYHSSFIENAL